jgi:hypothetical protein
MAASSAPATLAGALDAALAVRQVTSRRPPQQQAPPGQALSPNGHITVHSHPSGHLKLTSHGPGSRGAPR